MNQLALSTATAERQRGGYSGDKPSSIGIGSDGKECAEKDEYNTFSAALTREEAVIFL